MPLTLDLKTLAAGAAIGAAALAWTTPAPARAAGEPEYEYKVQVASGAAAVERQLNVRSLEGWELMAATASGRDQYLYLRRLR